MFNSIKKIKNGSGGFLGKMKEKAMEKAKKHIKRRICITIGIVVVLLLVIGVLVAVYFGYHKMIINTATTILDGDWVSFNASTNKAKYKYNKYVQSDAEKIDGGFLAGLGIDVDEALANIGEDKAAYMKLQAVQLYDYASVELGYPMTLLGITLLTKECTFFSASETEGKPIMAGGNWNIYKNLMNSNRLPSPPSNRGGGKRWHTDTNKNAKYTYPTDSNNVGYEFSKGTSNTVKGYFNHGAFGIAQIEADYWISESDAWTYNGAAGVSKDKVHTKYLIDNKSFVDTVMEKVGQSNYLTNIEGKSYTAYDEWALDLGNMTTCIMATITYSACQRPYLGKDRLDGKLTGYGDMVGGHTSQYSEIWDDLSEEEKNVLAVISWLQLWNGGNVFTYADADTENEKTRLQILVDLTKFLVRYGAQPFYDKGWGSIGNGINGAATADGLGAYLKILTEVLYSGDSSAQNKAFNALSSSYLNYGGSQTYSGYIYCIDGIIRAQKVAESVAKLAGYTDAFNIYTVNYTGASNYTATKAKAVCEGAISFIESEYGTGAEYSLLGRNEEHKFDTSSLIARAFSCAGLNLFYSEGNPDGINTIVNKLTDTSYGAVVIYKAELQSSINKTLKSGGQEAREGYGNIAELKNGATTRMKRGDLIVWDCSNAGDGTLTADNKNNLYADRIAIYLGDGKIAEMREDGLHYEHNLDCLGNIVLVARITDSTDGVKELNIESQ